jgi:hypothetical protein
VTAHDGSRAYPTADGQQMTAYNFGITQPSGAGAITKVEVGGEAVCTGDDLYSLALSWDNGSNYTAAVQADPPATHGDILYYDLTSGRSWTWSELTDGALVLLITYVQVGGTGTSVGLDYVCVRVTYSTSGYLALTLTTEPPSGTGYKRIALVSEPATSSAWNRVKRTGD